ncbi:MAG: GtrA family protein [Rhodoferax sp.]|nr:GtrA family protein [Rhodoferax sp.]
MPSATASQFLKYGVVGAAALGLDVATFTVLRVLGFDLIASNVLARLVGALGAYLGNFLWTFDHPPERNALLRSGWRYAALWVGSTFLSTVLVGALVYWGLNETASKLGVEILMPLLNFFIARMWVFRA